MSDSIRRTAVLAMVGGLLIAASVAAELVYPVQTLDGTTREPFLHSIYLIGWIVGWILIAVMATGLARTFATAGRKAAIGGWLVVIGATGFAVSGLGQLIGVVAGVYLEVMFVLFLIAFPLVVVGCVLLGLAIRRSASPAWLLLVLAAVAFVVALIAEMDPYHDVGLIGGALAVAGAGLALLGVTPGRDGAGRSPPPRALTPTGIGQEQSVSDRCDSSCVAPSPVSAALGVVRARERPGRGNPVGQR